ncbi:hypothetical protein KC872_05170 [Candidatus Kaiserbacteria bacterium]|nr:hypothetical protein [Candidatus Kaiserbacteria bacterium]
MNQGSTGFCNGHYETWYLGSNEQAFQYNKYGTGGWVDDGLFVAIPDGGAYNGYSYYELQHPRAGWIDGGPAHLPKNPGALPVNGYFPIARRGHCHHNSGPHVPPPTEHITVSNRGHIPELPDGSLIPIGSKFFFWVSGGGGFQLSTQIVQQLKSKQITLKAQAIPKPAYALWFEPSPIVEKTFTLIEES